MMTAPVDAPSREVTLTCVFNAPQQLVWTAWTNPRHLAQWWGPKMFTNPVCELDLRPGGALRVDMCAPDGTLYPMTGTFKEIVPPKRLVFTSVARDKEGNALLEGYNVITFEDVGGKTRVTVQSRAVGLVPIAPQMLAGMEAGWTQSLEKLATLVEGR
jgi:uncharacterized protein YndB with AHSA1/START domain